LDQLFSIGEEFHTSVNVVNELNESHQKLLSRFLRKNQLTLHVMEELRIPISISNHKSLSQSDKSILALSLQLDAYILTGDNVVRKISGVQKIETHGILWLFDRFIEKKLITNRKALQKLGLLRSFNKRLPFDECEQRIRVWS
jgi:hypothetical protein